MFHSGAEVGSQINSSTNQSDFNRGTDGQDFMHQRIQTLRNRMHEQERIVQEIHQYLHSKTSRGRTLDRTMPNLPKGLLPSPEIATPLHNRTDSTIHYGVSHDLGALDIPLRRSPGGGHSRMESRTVAAPTFRATRSASPVPVRGGLVPMLSYSPYPAAPIPGGLGALRPDGYATPTHAAAAIQGSSPRIGGEPQPQVSPPPSSHPPGTNSAARTALDSALNSAYEAATSAVQRYDDLMEAYQRREGSGGKGGEDREWEEALRRGHEAAQGAINHYQKLLRASAEGVLPDPLLPAPPDDDLHSHAETETSASRDTNPRDLLPAPPLPVEVAPRAPLRGHEEARRRRGEEEARLQREQREAEEAAARQRLKEEAEVRAAEALRRAAEERAREAAEMERRAAEAAARAQAEEARLEAEKAALEAARREIEAERGRLAAERRAQEERGKLAEKAEQEKEAQRQRETEAKQAEAAKEEGERGGPRLSWTEAGAVGGGEEELSAELGAILGECAHADPAEAAACGTCQRLRRQRSELLRVLHLQVSAAAAAHPAPPHPHLSPASRPPPYPSPPTHGQPQPHPHSPAHPPPPSAFPPPPPAAHSPARPALPAAPNQPLPPAPPAAPAPPPPAPPATPPAPSVPQNTPFKTPPLKPPDGRRGSDSLPPPPPRPDGDDLPPPPPLRTPPAEAGTPGSAERTPSHVKFEKAMEEHDKEEHQKEEQMHEKARTEALHAIRDTKETEMAKAMQEENRRLDHLRKKGFSGFDPYALAAMPPDDPPS